MDDKKSADCVLGLCMILTNPIGKLPRELSDIFKLLYTMASSMDAMMISC